MKHSKKTEEFISLAEDYGTHNYHPLEVVICKGEGEWVWDIDDKKYLDMLSAYSAVNQGHCHPKMLETLSQQAQKLTLSSRAFHNDKMGPWLKQLTTLCQMEMAIPMNTGAEAVETAIKIARKWGYLKKKITPNSAKIITCHENFHGRTTTIVGFSTETQYKENFGPFSDGFSCIPFGDAEALEKAITPDTVGFLVEPIQGEAGIIVPSENYLSKVSEICKRNNILLMMDEIQTGLGRTGKLFAYQYENITPDLLILGKALGGAFYPISAVVGFKNVMEVLQPGDHGSTFGGNPLACALSQTAMNIIINEKLTEKAYYLGDKFRTELKNRCSKKIIKEVRGKGLLNAVEIYKEAGTGRYFSEQLQQHGILAKETHGQTIRFAPPLIIQEKNLDLAIETIVKIFQ
jgi:ornithine--oxo-acid transaminase